MLDTEPIVNESNHVPIILGKPFLATANAIINFRNGFMQLTFGNMTLELNIFHLNNKHRLPEDENQMTDEVVSIGQHAGKLSVQELQASQGEEEVWYCLQYPQQGNCSIQNPSVRSQAALENSTSRNQLKPLQGLRRSSSLTLLEQFGKTELIWCSQKPNCSSTIFSFYFNLVNFNNFSYF